MAENAFTLSKENEPEETPHGKYLYFFYNTFTFLLQLLLILKLQFLQPILENSIYFCYLLLFLQDWPRVLKAVQCHLYFPLHSATLI
jgi:hypothetical protein